MFKSSRHRRHHLRTDVGYPRGLSEIKSSVSAFFFFSFFHPQETVPFPTEHLMFKAGEKGDPRAKWPVEGSRERQQVEFPQHSTLAGCELCNTENQILSYAQ